MFFQTGLILAATLWSVVLATPVPRGSPTVTLDQATFIGAPAGNANKFLGIPFAKPPTGDLRLRLPVANDPYTGTHQAASFGLACSQQASSLNVPNQTLSGAFAEFLSEFANLTTPEGEDCLTLNVWTPANVPKGTKLPVVFWIYGGSFASGSTSTYDGGAIVNHSIDLGAPVVYVSTNYRLNAFGFLPGAEVKQAGVGNLGLQDQRQAMRWVQKYISAFNGDPTKVTIWGESAGAISVSLHLLTNNGNNEGLFRGAFMESGAPIPTGDITSGQPVYDGIVALTGCSNSSDTLQCLREVPFATLKSAVDNLPPVMGQAGLNLPYTPKADGIFLTDGPQQLVLKGEVAKVPFVSGNNDDEGTLFTLDLLNITTNAETASFFKTTFLPGANSSTINEVLDLYPQDPSAGSPYDTGELNALTPEFKRIASFQGDLVFQAPRRFFLQQRSDKQPTWSYLSKRFKATPDLGSFHASELLIVYGAGDLSDYLINFANNLNPNGPTVTQWPQYSNSNPQLLTLLDGLIPRTITPDNYRAEQMELLTQLSLTNPV